MATSLDQIKAKLKSPDTPYNECPVHEHSVLGKVYIGKLSTGAYCELEAFDVIPARVAQWEVKKQIEWQKSGKLRVFLRHSVFLEDGSRLDEEAIDLIVKGNFGSENQKLFLKCSEENPPREYLVEEVFAMLQCNAWIITLLDAAVKGGLMEVVNAYLAGKAGDPEVDKAAETLALMEDALPMWKAFFQMDKLEAQKIIKEASDESAAKAAEAVTGAISDGLQ